MEDRRFEIIAVVTMDPNVTEVGIQDKEYWKDILLESGDIDEVDIISIKEMA